MWALILDVIVVTLGAEAFLHIGMGVAAAGPRRPDLCAAVVLAPHGGSGWFSFACARSLAC